MIKHFDLHLCFFVRDERHFNLTLRQQQDEAYQLSLSADREKVGKQMILITFLY